MSEQTSTPQAALEAKVPLKPSGKVIAVTSGKGGVGKTFVSANLAANQARSSASADLKRVMDTLRDVADDLGKFISTDPRGKHVYPLLDSLAQKLVDEQSRMVAEIDNLNEGIDHIKELVQRYEEQYER